MKPPSPPPTYSTTLPPPLTPGGRFRHAFNNNNNTSTTNYQHSTDHLCVPNDDVAELEWLSNFVDDSFSDFSMNNIAGIINFHPENTSFNNRLRSKRTREPSNNNSWTSTPIPSTPISETSKTKKETYSSMTCSLCDTTLEANVVRFCTRFTSEKTPQWRTGPLGPKILCNACGMRYKSGQLRRRWGFHRREATTVGKFCGGDGGFIAPL